MYDKQTLVKKRTLVKELFFTKHLNKSEIARKIAVSYPFVLRWTTLEEEPTKDKRGWPKGKRRSRTQEEEQRIIAIRKELNDKKAFFFGPDRILGEYHLKYPQAKEVSRPFITRVIHEAFPESHQKMLKATKEQNYPLKALSFLGKTKESIDFVGHKFLKGQRQPIHFFTRVYSSPFILRLIKRVESQRMETALEITSRDWKAYPLPDCLWLDNGFGFVASGGRPRVISPFIQYLLSLGITPVFIAPKKPWMNGGVEGTNSVFAKKVWQRHKFKNLSEIDQVLSRFEAEYQLIHPLSFNKEGKYLESGFTYKDMLSKPFDPKSNMAIYLIRLVEVQENQLPAIRIFKEQMVLDYQYVNTYVLVKINLFKETVMAFTEKENGSLQTVAERKFPLKFAKLKL